MAKNNYAQPVADEEVSIDKVLKTAEESKVEIEDMPLTNIREYRLYNEAARAANKKLKICRYPAKPCPIDLHPKQRVVFRRNDQPSNPLPVYVSNSLIHYDETLIPGRTYDLPECIVAHLSEKGDPEWGWVDLPNGERETRIIRKKPRFSLTTVYQEQ